MGKLFDLLKSSAGERNTRNALGRWRQAVSAAIDAGLSAAITVLDEGVSLGSFQSINFQGAGVIATPGPPGQVDVTIPGGGGGSAAVQGLYTCPAGVAVRDAVYLSSADNVDQADADDAGKQPLIGIVDSKPGATSAVVTYYGEVSGFAGLTPGDTYYLSITPGQITNVSPSNPGEIVQRIGFAKSATVLMVMVDRDWTVLT